MNNKIEFKTVTDQLICHGKYLGFRFDTRITCLDSFLQGFHCTTLLSLVASYVIYAVHERRYGTADYFADAVSMCISTIGLVGSYSNFHIFMRQSELKKLLVWCEKIYSPQRPEKRAREIWEDVFRVVHGRSIKFVKLFFGFVIWDSCFLLTGAVLSKLVLEEGLLLLPLYKMNGFVQDMPWYWLLTGWEFVVIVGFLLQFCYNLSIFVVLTEHINGQLKYIGELLQGLDECCERSAVPKEFDTRAGKFLDHAITLHVEVLDVIKSFSKIFNFPMLLSELAPLACFVLVGLTLFIKHSDYLQAASTTSLIFSAAIYASFGDSIIVHGKELAVAAYSYGWYNLSLRNQKKLNLILRMSQKQIGISSGGFHDVCYLQFSNVSILLLRVVLLINPRLL